VCPLHLPKGDKRREAAIESNRQRTKAFWQRRRELKAAIQANIDRILAAREAAGMTVIPGPVTTKAA
jgi:hypothetical protein